ncbi:MAG: thioredoxin-disulfide reductase [Clostridium sp.]|nr:thioredoxin-disulfide reductase [Clostridium sp.]MCM1172648.1 thioredoxin-disulfide reductase [Clostridium sp.]MCM1207691.1 thioredoxin-disulfide reductase [Ruminococcus sp.]
MYDLIIIGSGPAGLSAAVYAMRARLNTVIIEKEAYSGGQIVNTERVDNYLGMYGTSGFDLANAFKGHANSLGAQFMSGLVKGLVDAGTHKTVCLSDGKTLDTRAVLIATGARHKMLGVLGEEKFKGMGVSYCATCDGAFYKGKTVACVGGGNVALEDALYLSNLCDTVYLIHRREELRASRDVQDKVKAKKNIIFMPYYVVTEICGSDALSEIVIKNNQTEEEKRLAVSGVFVAVGMEPETDFAKGLVKMDEKGYIIADESCLTSCDGIFAAGDARTKEVRQVVTAVSDGACALHFIEAFLNTIP